MFYWNLITEVLFAVFLGVGTLLEEGQKLLSKKHLAADYSFVDSFRIFCI